MGIGVAGGATHRKVAMRKTLPFLTVTILLLGLVASTFIMQTHASFFIAQSTHIAFHAQADLIMGVDFTFNVDTITYGNGSINIGGAWLNSTCDMTLMAFNSGNWTNYTVTSAGSQQIYNGTKPNRVFLNGILHSEYSGWTYSAGIITVTGATSSASLYWGPLVSSTVSVTGSVLYFRSDTHTINTEVGYILKDSQTTGGLAVSGTTVDVAISVSWGFQVYLVGTGGSTIELTGGSPVALLTRSVNGAGIQNASWVVGETWLNMGFDAIMVKVYLKLGADAWVLKATHITTLLLEKKINSTTLVFSCYTEYSSTAYTTTGTFRFGNSTYNSFIQGIAFQEPTMLDWMLYNMQNGNLIGALLLPYTYLIGGVFYIFVLLFVSVPLYKRYESINPVLFVMLVFGGSGGVISLLLPVQALSVGWIVMVLAVAGILYKLVRSTGF